MSSNVNTIMNNESPVSNQEATVSVSASDDIENGESDTESTNTVIIEAEQYIEP